MPCPNGTRTVLQDARLTRAKVRTETVWAWRSGRAEKMARSIDHVPAKDRAQAMVDNALKGNKGFAKIASTLGKDDSPYPQGGWGNVGSSLFTVFGDPVAKPDPKGLKPAE